MFLTEIKNEDNKEETNDPDDSNTNDSKTTPINEGVRTGAAELSNVSKFPTFLSASAFPPTFALPAAALQSTLTPAYNFTPPHHYGKLNKILLKQKQKRKKESTNNNK